MNRPLAWALRCLAVGVVVARPRQFTDSEVLDSLRPYTIAWQAHYNIGNASYCGSQYLEDGILMFRFGPLAAQALKAGLANPSVVHGPTKIAEFWRFAMLHLGLKSLSVYDQAGLDAIGFVVADNMVTLVDKFNFGDAASGHLFSDTWVRVAGYEWKLRSTLVEIESVDAALDMSSHVTKSKLASKIAEDVQKAEILAKKAKLSDKEAREAAKEAKLLGNEVEESSNKDLAFKNKADDLAAKANYAANEASDEAAGAAAAAALVRNELGDLENPALEEVVEEGVDDAVHYAEDASDAAKAAAAEAIAEADEVKVKVDEGEAAPSLRSGAAAIGTNISKNLTGSQLPAGGDVHSRGIGHAVIWLGIVVASSLVGIHWLRERRRKKAMYFSAPESMLG